MSTLSTDLEGYLRLRRSLGYKLERAGKVLADFVDYAEAAGADHVLTELAVSWALQTSNPDSNWRAGRLGTVRCFARYLHAVDPIHQVPPVGLIPRGTGRPTPCLFSNDQVVALMTAARRLRSPVQAATLETVIGLLAATGLRVGEALRLDNGDLDTRDAALTVRNSKGGQSRIVPLDASVVEAITAYWGIRDRRFEPRRCDSLFVSTVGRRLSSGNLGAAFASVVDLAGLPARRARSGPRLADLRHSFAVQTLLDWHNAGLDVGARLPLLSAYMGHASPASTYWYLSAAPELLALAAGRLELSRRVISR